MKNLYVIFKCTILLVGLSLFASCDNKDSMELSCPESASFYEISSAELTYAIVGEQIPNPLSLDIVKDAFSQLDYKTRAGYSAEDIVATHHYVAFKPGNDDEFCCIKATDDIDLFSYPLDYEVSDGFVVPDQRFMTGEFPYQWAYVPVEYDLSAIKCPYDILYDIWSPETGTKSSEQFPEFLNAAIEEKAYELCGQPLEKVMETKAGKVTPSGRVVFYDKDSGTYRGVEGLSIKTARATHSSYTHCDRNGYFVSSGSFRYAFTYEIHFSRTDFEIRENGTKTEVIYKYSNYKGSLDKSYADSESCFYANISRAAIVYYYGNIYGLRRPPMRSDKSYRLVIQAQNSSNGNVAGSHYVKDNWIFPDRPIVKIYKLRSNNSERPTWLIHATMIHELAHASHWRSNSKFDETSTELVESFAMGVEWFLSKNEYQSYIPDYTRQSYTGIIQDLIDGYGYKYSVYSATWINGEYLQNQGSAELGYYDKVTGFTAPELEEMVRSSTSWNEFQSRVLSSPKAEGQQQAISESFTYWMKY